MSAAGGGRPAAQAGLEHAEVSVLTGHLDQAAELARGVAALPAFLAYRMSAEGLVRSWRTAAAAPAHQARLRLALRGGRALAVAWSLPRGAFAMGAYLRFLAVLPAAHGQGLGALLLADFEAASAPPGGWFVLTGAGNVAAQAFYARHGYREVGVLDGFVRAGLQERLWWKQCPRAGG